MTTLDETTALSIRDRELLPELKAAIQAVVPASVLYLYGSVARGTRHAESDYDVLVLMEHPLASDDRSAVHRAVMAVELKRDVVCLLFFCDNHEWEHGPVAGSPFRREVERDAIRL